MYLTKTNHNLWVVDVEGDPIPSSKVWVVCCKNVETGEEVRLREYEDIRSWFEARYSDSKFIGHNFLGYDAPTLNRIVGTKITVGMIIDTMIMSMVYSPSFTGGHSLGNWGIVLKFPKTDWNDFSKYSPLMEEYCMNDVRLTLRVYKALFQRMNQVGFSDTGLEIEHRSWALIQKQKQNGFAFNIKEAHILYAKIKGIVDDLNNQVEVYWPPRLERVASFAKSHKKDGTPTANFERHTDQYVDVRRRDDGGYDAYDYVRFNIGSPAQRVEKLRALGWLPYDDEWTIIKAGERRGEKGQPTPTKKGMIVPSLEKFVQDSGKEEVRLIARWLDYNARATNINTWLEAYDDRSGCIHGSLWLANTLRYRHSDPNTANIPAVRLDKEDNPLKGEAGSYTYEARDLWTTRGVDRVLVGVDAKGIQLRVLAHYLNNKDFIDAVLGGDPHSYNQSIGGFATRAIAKTYIYAYLLGAGDAKVGQIISGSPKEGKAVKAKFVANFPGLKELMDDLQKQVDRTGRIKLCDGTPLIVTKPHTRLGYLLQGDESRIMKKAMILIDQGIRKEKIDTVQVGFIHDELQFDTREGDVNRFKDVCYKAFNEAGAFFEYRLPIDADASVGRTWAQSH